jgi:hypothetical protein
MVDFSQVIVNWPQHELAPVSHLELARTLFIVCQPSLAVSELYKLIANYPRSPAVQPATLEFGKQYLQDDLVDSACDAFWQCINMNAETEDALESRFYLACLDEEDGAIDAAVEEFRAISHDDLHLHGEMQECGARAEFQLGKMLANHGCYEDAVQVFTALVVDAAGLDLEPAARFELALSLLAIGQVDQAKEHLMGLLEDYSNCEYETSARRVLSELR